MAKKVKLKLTNLTPDALDAVKFEYVEQMEENDGVCGYASIRFIAEALIDKGLLDRHQADQTT
jgi:hypothetical protein